MTQTYIYLNTANAKSVIFKYLYFGALKNYIILDIILVNKQGKNFSVITQEKKFHNYKTSYIAIQFIRIFPKE